MVPPPYQSVKNACAGVEDDGYLRGLPEAELGASLGTLRAMAAEARASAHVLARLPCGGGHQRGRRSAAAVRVRRVCRDEMAYTDLRIAGAAPGRIALFGRV